MKKRLLIAFSIWFLAYLVIRHHIANSSSYGVFSDAVNNMMTDLCTVAFVLLGLFIAIIIFKTDSPSKDSNKNSSLGTKLDQGMTILSDSLKYNKTPLEIAHFQKNADPYQLDLSQYPIQDWPDTEGIIFGNANGHCIHRKSRADGNIALFALPGGGKTTAQIIPTALRFQGSILAIDIKGDIYTATKHWRFIKVFSPSDKEHSCHFDPFAGIADMSLEDRDERLSQIAKILIPSASSDKDKYFQEGAVAYFVGVSHYLLDQDLATQFSDVIEALVLGRLGNALEIVIKIISSDSLMAKSYLASFKGNNEKNVAGCYDAAVRALRPLLTLIPLLNSEGDCISIDTLNNGYDIYIEIPQDKIAVYSPVTSLIIQTFMQDFMRRPDRSKDQETRPVLFLLDEFPQLQFDFATISAALSTLRSKNVSLFLAMQSIAQLENRYGQGQAREIIDTCSYISVMSAQDPSSRDFFSKLLGEKTVLKKQGDTTIELKEPIIEPATFGDLDDQVLIYAHGKYVIADKCYYFNSKYYWLKQNNPDDDDNEDYIYVSDSTDGTIYKLYKEPSLQLPPSNH